MMGCGSCPRDFTSKKCLSLLKGVVVIVCSQTVCTCISGLTSCYSTVNNIKCAYAHPCTVLGWSECLENLGNPEKGRWYGLYL